MDLTTPHFWIGFALISLWAVISGWSFALRLLKHDETPTFWRVVSVAQILLACHRLAHDLESDGALRAQVVGAVDDAYPTPAYLALDDEPAAETPVFRVGRLFFHFPRK